MIKSIDTLRVGLGPALIPLKLTATQRRQMSDAAEATGLSLDELVLLTDEVLIIQPRLAPRNKSKDKPKPADS